MENLLYFAVGVISALLVIGVVIIYLNRKPPDLW